MQLLKLPGSELCKPQTILYRLEEAKEPESPQNSRVQKLIFVPFSVPFTAKTSGNKPRKVKIPVSDQKPANPINHGISAFILLYLNDDKNIICMSWKHLPVNNGTVYVPGYGQQERACRPFLY